MINGLLTSHALANRIAIDHMTFGRIRPLDERLAAIQAVTAEDIKRVASAYLLEGRRNVVRVIAPPEEAAP